MQTHQTPGHFRAKAPEDFIGTTADVARLRVFQARRLAATREANFKVLLWGAPGVGKSNLAALLASTLAGGAALNVETKNGQSTNVDVIRKWTEEGHYRPMLGLRRVKIIEECDAMSAGALNEFRTWCDSLAPGVDLIMTTNMTLSQLQPQLQSRCSASECQAIDPKMIAKWLEQRWNIPPNIAGMIANTGTGDVRAALNDAQTWLDTVAMAAAA